MNPPVESRNPPSDLRRQLLSPVGGSVAPDAPTLRRIEERLDDILEG